ncbi:hypothetical protein ATK74_2838 [Propionicimonas paludicola]|uniref:Uncharacterized protein n=1 Tax=Propionicimonas paludicola TaxID=185243 RepID=A0A2A9CV06_9ACTN|nr:hypothetical protein [Propionicimonas paludicola]PFG18254.1 hypothetical protein ATK74_2838 [Propionicimonas paludicola]
MPGSTPAEPSASALPRLVTSEGKDTSRGHNDPDGLWAQAERDAADELIDDAAELREHQRNWRRAVESDFPPGGDITVDPRTFMPLQELMVEGFGVTGPNPGLLKSPDPTLLREALRRATERILRVRADGRELSESQVEGRGEADDDEGDEEGEQGETDDDYTPNYLSEPEGYTGVVGISNFDTKGVAFVWLERTTLRIVAEELRRSGAVPARIVPYLDVDTLAWLREHGETYPSDAELR